MSIGQLLSKKAIHILLGKQKAIPMDDNLQQHNESNTQYSFTGPTILPEENRHDRHPQVKIQRYILIMWFQGSAMLVNAAYY